MPSGSFHSRPCCTDLGKIPRYVRKHFEEQEQERARQELADTLMMKNSAAYQERKRIMAALWVRLLEDRSLTHEERVVVQHYIMSIEEDAQ